MIDIIYRLLFEERKHEGKKDSRLSSFQQTKL